MAFTPTYLSGRPGGFYREGRHLFFLPRVGARYIVPSSRDHHTYLPPIAPLGKIGSCRAGFLKPAFLTLLPLFPCRGHLLRWPFWTAAPSPLFPSRIRIGKMSGPTFARLLHCLSFVATPSRRLSTRTSYACLSPCSLCSSLCALCVKNSPRSDS